MALDLRIDVVDHGDGMDDECMERMLETGNARGALDDVPRPLPGLDGQLPPSGSPTR